MLKLAVAPEPNPNQNGGVDPIVLGERVRTLRLKKKWTQKQLARAAHVTENTVRGLERGTLATRRPKFEQIALALDTTTDLLQRADQPIAEGHPLLDGLNDDDLRMAQAYSRARTTTRLRVEKLLLANNDAGLAILERILALDDHRRQLLLAALEQSEHAIEKERDALLKKRKPPTP